jgi:hypothetical protein
VEEMPRNLILQDIQHQAQVSHSTKKAISLVVKQKTSKQATPKAYSVSNNLSHEAFFSEKEIEKITKLLREKDSHKKKEMVSNRNALDLKRGLSTLIPTMKKMPKNQRELVS